MGDPELMGPTEWARHLCGYIQDDLKVAQMVNIRFDTKLSSKRVAQIREAKPKPRKKHPKSDFHGRTEPITTLNSKGLDDFLVSLLQYGARNHLPNMTKRMCEAKLAMIFSKKD